MEYLRDPVWQVVGVVLALVVPALIYFVQKQRKRLSYEVLADLAWMTEQETKMGGLEVRYDQQLVRFPGLVLFRVANSGNTPILGAEYETPLTISFGPSTKILACEVLGMDPPSLQIQAQLHAEGTSATFSRALLNPGDSFDCQVLVDGGGNLLVGGRVAGVKNIEQVRDWTAWGVGAAVFFLTVVYVLLYYAPKQPEVASIALQARPYKVAIYSSMALAFALMFRTMWVISARRRHSNKLRMDRRKDAIRLARKLDA